MNYYNYPRVVVVRQQVVSRCLSFVRNGSFVAREKFFSSSWWFATRTLIVVVCELINCEKSCALVIELLFSIPSGVFVFKMSKDTQIFWILAIAGKEIKI